MGIETADIGSQNAGERQMAKRTPKAKTLKILNEATMTYRIVNLYDVVFSLKAGGSCNVQVYSPNDEAVLATANELYADKGAFGSAISFVRA